MEIRGLAFLPLFWVTWTLLGLGALVTLTVTLGHNTKPFISDTAIGFPEWIIYKVTFWGTSILGAGIAYLQYRFMILRSEPSEKRHTICQRILLVIGWMVCIGTAMNAEFTMRNNPTVHRISAGMAFFLGAIYNLGQAGLLYKRTFSSRCMCHIRLAAVVVTNIVLLLFSAGQGAFYIELCTGRCETILYVPVLVLEYVGLCGTTLYQLTNFTDFQRLSVKLSREGVSICLREKDQDPENPE